MHKFIYYQKFVLRVKTVYKEAEFSCSGSISMSADFPLHSLIQCSDNLDSVLTVSLSISRYVREQWEGPPTTAMFRNLLQLFTTINKEIVTKISLRLGQGGVDV